MIVHGNQGNEITQEKNDEAGAREGVKAKKW